MIKKDYGFMRYRSCKNDFIIECYDAARRNGYVLTEALADSVYQIMQEIEDPHDFNFVKAFEKLEVPII